MTYIIGISAFYHDSAACLVKDGEIIAAAQEERFTRKKHDAALPKHAVAYCLRHAGIQISDVDYIGFYDKPLKKFGRILETAVGVAPFGLTPFMKAMPVWLKDKLNMNGHIRKELNFEGEILYGEHHESHAASAFYPSPYEEAAILTNDGVGEWATTTFGIGRGNELNLFKEIKFPHSIGLLYSAMTYYTGFKVNSGEYKVMGLAPYGEPKYVDKLLDNVIELKDDGSFRLNMDYFNYLKGMTMTNDAFADLFGGPAREAESTVTQKEMDLAKSVQVVVEKAILNQGRYVKEETGMDYLCLAGGVALNCVANGILLREKIFKDIWIQPAAGDAGGALGVALSIWHKFLNKERSATPDGRDRQSRSYLGPSFTEDQIKEYLDKAKYPYHLYEKDKAADEVAKVLEDQKVVGLFQGRMEFGPRALGGRSIIGDARSEEMQTTMNLKIKYRESFRPFAPSVLNECRNEFFDLDSESPYMLLVAPVQDKQRIEMSDKQKKLFGIEKLKVKRSLVPAITHVDYSARVQTVTEENGYYYDIIKAFKERTGSGVIVNTSFNVRGEPIVCTPEDAYRCFMRTEMDYLVLENFILDKREQPEYKEEGDWRNEFELD
ncbi:MAG: carbamoyltransferase [Planctomycetota bacterium]|nr:carbamoyltransferase [Planctomycetota bacterium]